MCILEQKAESRLSFKKLYTLINFNLSKCQDRFQITKTLNNYHNFFVLTAFQQTTNQNRAI